MDLHAPVIFLLAIVKMLYYWFVLPCIVIAIIVYIKKINKPK